MQPSAAPAKQLPTAAFVISLIAGLWMIASTSMVYSGMGWGMPFHHTGPGHMRGWMGHWGMQNAFVTNAWSPWLGLIAGISILLGAIGLYAKPEHRNAWGIAIIVVSALNLFLGMGGFLACILGIVGGILALTWHPQYVHQS